MEISMEAPQKIKNRITIWSSNPTSGYTSKEMKTGSRRGICTPMFIAAIFTIAKMCQLGALKTQIYNPASQKLEMSCLGLKSRCWQGATFWGLQGRICFLLLSASRGCQHPLVPGYITPISVALFPPSLLTSYKISCDYV